MRLALLILALIFASGCPDVPSPSDLGPPALPTAYPDTEAGFSAFINELLATHTRSSNAQRLMRSLVIPNSSAWFIETFGPTFGPILDFRYRHQLGWQFGRLYTFPAIIAHDRNLKVLWDYSDGGHLSPLVPESRLISLADRPLRIHIGSLSNGDLAMKIGYFVYINGSFRLFGNFDIESNAEQLQSEFDKPFEN